VPRLRRLLARRAGPLGFALTAFELWQRIPPKQRKQLIAQARKHGPRVAKQLAARRRKPPFRP
jgi:hypothetical protein